LWGAGPQPTIGAGSVVATYSSISQIGVQSGFNPMWNLSTTFGAWRVKKAVSRGSSTAIIRQDGTLWVSGLNQYGQLGLGDTINRSSFIQVGSSSNWLQVFMGLGLNGGGGNMFLIDTSGNLWATGSNPQGMLGVGDTANRSSLTLVPGGIVWERTGTNHFYAGGYIYDGGYSAGWTVAIAENGTMYSWGANGATQTNAKGMLGQGDIINRSTPTALPGSSTWKGVSGNFISGTTVAIKTDGTMWSWGPTQYYATLGDGSSTARSSPVQIGTGGSGKWKLVVGGNPSVHAIRDDNTLWGWGQGQQGQIGDGTTNDYSSMVQIGNGSQWIDILTYGYVGGGAIRDPSLN